VPKEEKQLQPWEDLIVSEVRRAREALFAEFDYNLAMFAKELRRKQIDTGRQVITRSPRRPNQGKNEAA
jgi:hypothetical protein